MNAFTRIAPAPAPEQMIVEAQRTELAVVKLRTNSSCLTPVARFLIWATRNNVG